MTLKEAFRHQKFLNELIDSAVQDITDREFFMTTTKTHNRKAENSEAEDLIEISDSGRNYEVNDVISFLTWLIVEKDKLSHAIGTAKANLDIDIDADIETNKQRQKISRFINAITKIRPRTTQERGVGYKFNVEGNQSPYYYNIDIQEAPSYDTNFAKMFARDLMKEADNLSEEIDQAMVNTTVDYYSRYDINASYEDNLLDYINR